MHLLITHIVAVADFDADEIVFSIPRTCVLSLPNLLPKISPDVTQKLSAMPNWLVFLPPSRSRYSLTVI